MDGACGNVMTKAQWARHMGWKSAGMAHQAVKEGRVVFASDGVHLLAVESKARYEATADPAHDAVAERHARERAGAATPADPGTMETPSASAAPDKIGNRYSTARAEKEHYLALGAKREYQIAIGRLLEKDAVASELASAMVTLRSSLERMPHVLGPALAPITDEHACTAAIADHVEQALRELSRAFSKITESSEE